VEWELKLKGASFVECCLRLSPASKCGALNVQSRLNSAFFLFPFGRPATCLISSLLVNVTSIILNALGAVECS